MADNKTTETIILDFQVDTGDAVKSIGNLTKANKDLREERKNLDLSTKEGKERIKEINAALDDNNKTIKENSSALEKSRLNVGNYTGALDKLVPGLGSTVNGFFDMTKAALAFIATPIGAVIGAIGLAIGALTAYFKGSEEGQNKWNKVVAIGSTLLEKLMDVAEAIGGVLVSIFEDPQKAIEDFWELLKENVVNRFEGILELIPALGKSIQLLFKGEFAESGKVAFDAVAKVTTGIANASDKIVAFTKEVIATTELAIAQGLKLAAIQAKIDSEERDLIVKRSKTDLEVSKLREKAISQEGDAKRKTINEAIALERKLADAEVKHAKDKQKLAETELEANGADKEAKMKVAEATAAVINAEAQRYQATLRFSKEIEKLNDAEAAQVKKLSDEKLKLFEKEWADKVAKTKEANEAMSQSALDQFNKELDMRKAAADAQKLVDDTLHKAIKGNLQVTFDFQKIQYGEAFKLFKKGAISQLIADTNKAAVAAMASVSGIPFVGAILGPIAFAATYAKGIATVAAVAGLNFGFKQGGFTGAGNSNEIAGPVHRNEFVMPAPIVAKYGKEHFQSYMDGSVVANSMTKGMNAGGGQNMQPIYVSWKEFTEYRDRQDVKKAVVTA